MLFCFCREARIAGLELADLAIETATQEAKRLGFSRVDLRKYEPGMQYPTCWREQFDLVISSHVLEHCEHPDVALADLLKQLKPAGLACLIVPINEMPGQDLNHFHWFTPESLIRLGKR